MLIENLVKIIDDILPRQSGFEGDRLGLQLQSGRLEVSHVLVTLEITPEVVREAIELKADAIITFHPLIYKPLAEIIDNERVGELTTLLIQNSIAVISVHTAFDAYRLGTSHILAEKLGLEVTGFLMPNNNFPECGIGIVAEPETELFGRDLARLVSDKLFAPVKYNFGRTDLIKKIAIIGGSGSSFLDEAIASGADAFITADVSYHTFHAASGKIMIIDPGHYEMEQFVSLGIARLLSDNLNNELKIDVSVSYTNPVRYSSNGTFEISQKEYLNNVKIKWYN